MARFRILIAAASIIVGAFALVSCNRAPIKPGPSTPPPREAEGTLVIRGFATCAACIERARGDRLDVQVIDVGADATRPLLSDSVFTASREQRIRFTVPVEREWLAHGRTLALRATLRGEAGSLRAATARMIVLPAAPSGTVDIAMVPVSVR